MKTKPKPKMILEDEEFERAELDFKHDYDKLKNDEFTTIRGKTKYNKFHVGQIIKITKQGKYFCEATIFNKELKRICDMSLEFLKADAEYPDFTIYTHDDFVHLINSFRPPYYHQANVHSPMSVFYLIKIT
ncbi:MAG: hypothetical protein ACFFDT_30265 [Candidatus Hodarchaeota archaeon]